MVLVPGVWRSLQVQDIGAVVAMEQSACTHPAYAWSAENYHSTIRSNHWAQVCTDTQGVVQGVCVVMVGVDEAHLLNLAVAKDFHGQGLAKWMLSEVDIFCQSMSLDKIWLEVRPSNVAALSLYRLQMFEHVSTRKAYYWATNGREDAWVMNKKVSYAKVE